VTATILLFLAFGLCFGLATLSNRHLFSEGPSRKGQAGGDDDTLSQRVMWVLICSTLWPILALTGVYSLVRRARVRADDARSRNRPG